MLSSAIHGDDDAELGTLRGMTTYPANKTLLANERKSAIELGILEISPGCLSGWRAWQAN